MNEFKRQMEINAVNGKEPVLFNHKNSFDCQENYKLHLNKFLEIFILIKGDIGYVIENNHYFLNSGDIMLITPHAVHVPVLKDPCNYERFYFLIPKSTFSEYIFDPVSDLLNRAEKISPHLKLSEKSKKNAIDTLYKISSLCSPSADEGTKMKAYALTLDFLISLSSKTSDFNVSPPDETEDLPKLVKNILSFICQCPEQISSVNDIAEHFYVSAPYLSSLFKKHVGVTAGAYLRTKKIALAKKLLEEGRTVTEACYESGFYDCSYFIKVFKTCTGSTPKRYKSIYFS